MKTTTRKSDNPLRLTWTAIMGPALVLAGISYSLRNLWRVVRGEDAPVSLLFCLVFAGAGIVLLRRGKRKQRAIEE